MFSWFSNPLAVQARLLAAARPLPGLAVFFGFEHEVSMRRELYPIGTRGGNVTIVGVVKIAKGLDESMYLVKYHCCGVEKPLSHKRFRMVLNRSHYLGAPICRKCARHNSEVRRQIALAGQPAPAPGVPWLPPYGCADVVGAWPVPPSLRVELAASAGWQP